MFKNIIDVLLGQQFNKHFYLQFCSADYQALVKVYNHTASPAQYCLTLVEKVYNHNKQLVVSLWSTWCELALYQESSSHPSPVLWEKSAFKKYLSPAGPEMQLPISSKFLPPVTLSPYLQELPTWGFGLWKDSAFSYMWAIKTICFSIVDIYSFV